jgi:glycosyltransferase involved in cell wall biosynthesis
VSRLRARSRNATILLDLEACDAGYAPTYWQWSRLPVEFQPKVSVIHDGINTDLWKPANVDRAGPRQIGDWTIPAGTKLVTYVSRGFESMRGFDVFMQVAKRICDERNDVVFAVVGEDRICYGGDKQFTGGKSFKEWVLSRDVYDLKRIRFLGRMPPTNLARLLGVTDLHLYLTTPFVLSWSMLNAMACGAVVLASDTPPVREVVHNGRNGLLAGFNDLDRWCHLANEVLNVPAAYPPLGVAARECIEERYSVRTCLPKLLSLFRRVANRTANFRAEQQRAGLTSSDLRAMPDPVGQLPETETNRHY